MKKIVFALGIICAMPDLSNVCAKTYMEEKSAASATVRELSDKALQKVKEHNVLMPDVIDYFWQLLDQYFAIKSIAVLALKLYWKQMNDEQKKAFASQLQNMLARTYSSRFVDFKEATCNILSEREKTKRMTEVISSVEVANKSYKVIWTFDIKQKKIVDVSIDGVSILQSIVDVTQSSIAEKKLGGFLKDWADKYENLHQDDETQQQMNSISR